MNAHFPVHQILLIFFSFKATFGCNAGVMCSTYNKRYSASNK